MIKTKTRIETKKLVIYLQKDENHHRDTADANSPTKVILLI